MTELESSTHNRVDQPRSIATDVEIPVRQLAREITATDQDTTLDQATGEQYRNVYTSLIQSHLPALDAINAISYDENRKLIEPDQNLLPLTIVMSTTSAVARMLFYSTIAGVQIDDLENEEPFGD